MQPSEKPKEVEAVVLKSFLDMPPLESRPSLAERVAKLEAKVEVLEAQKAEARVLSRSYCGTCNTETVDTLFSLYQINDNVRTTVASNVTCSICGRRK